MSSIGGKVREQSSNDNNYEKKVGIFEANVVAINPTAEEYSSILGREISPDSKATEYLGESKDGNTYLRIDVWLQEVKNQDNFKVSFFLEDKQRQNRDGTKNQYINSVGTTSWADDESNLFDWFTKDRDFRVAYVGEEDLYGFMQKWLSKLDYRDVETELQLDWKKLMRGDVRDLKSQIDGEYSNTVVSMATVVVRERDGESKEYQGIYNKGFLSGWAMKFFRAVDYTDRRVVESLKSKSSRDLKQHERFVVQIAGEYGCKDYYVLKEIESYNPGDNLVASDKHISEDEADY
tara:strand:+ start:266 stop:1141 length:876 start_codon:yes stop_codon:yes gene_type:complete